jgi:hypothetical protein
MIRCHFKFFPFFGTLQERKIWQPCRHVFVPDALLLAVATPHAGQHRVRHLPRQEIAAKPPKTWTRRLRTGKLSFLNIKCHLKKIESIAFSTKNEVCFTKKHCFFKYKDSFSI